MTSTELSIGLLHQISPLFFFMMLGVLAGGFLGLESRHLARLMIYLLTPLVIFHATSRAALTEVLLFMPLLVWVMASAVALLMLWVGRFLLADSRANIVALGSACGNTGYFGIPVALVLLGESLLPVYIVVMLGVTLFESSLGFYLAAAGRHSPTEALLRVLKLPALYAFALGLGANAGFNIPESGLMHSSFSAIQQTYMVLGMMIVGLAVGQRSRLAWDLPLTLLLGVGKFVLWPVLAWAVISIDGAWTQLLTAEIGEALWLVSIMPVAANTVVIASLLDLHVNTVASATLLSTLLALAGLPWLLQ